MRHSSSTNERKYRSPIVDTAAAVFDLLAEHADGMSLADVTKALGASRSSVYRVLNSLVANRLVDKPDGNALYRIGPRVVELARRISPTADRVSVVEVARPLMEAASAQMRESTKLSFAEGGETITVHVVESPEDYGVYSRVGSRRPLHATAAGKAILAYWPIDKIEEYCSQPLARRTTLTIVDPETLLESLEVIRAQGYAEDQGESNLSVRAIGAPIFGANGSVVAAISVPYLGDLAPDRRRALRQQLVATAGMISRHLGGDGAA